MNRTDIAHQVSLTLDDHADSFDIDAILDDLAEAGVTTSVDDIDSDTYWEIIRRHDIGAQAEEQAEKAHDAFLKAEAAYKAATVARQVAFAQAIDAMGRGGNAILSRKVDLSAPTIKSIADRGRELLAGVHVFEDNAGQVYLKCDGADHYWYVGVVTHDMHGRFADDAEGWLGGDWEPNEDDGQERYDGEPGEGLARIATWSAAEGLKVARKWNGDIEAGAGGQLYLGVDETGAPRP
jgi:hypothetical protein